MTQLNETAKTALIRTLASLDQGRGISVQNVFLRVAHALDLKIKPRDVTPLAECLPVIRDLVDEGIIEYWHSETMPRYTLREGATRRACCRTEPTGAVIRALNNRGNGLRALELMSARPFYVSRDRVQKELDRVNADLEILPQAWKDGILRGEEYSTQKASLEAKQIQCKALLSLPECAVYFDSAADYRGRLYFGGGLASPHNGRFAREVFTRTDEVTLDCRSSFAQMIAILTGDAALGRACGLGTTQDCDLYIAIGMQAGLSEEFCARNRDPLKYSIMPRAYGAGEERTKETLTNAGFTAEQTIAVVKRLDAFTRLAKRAQAAAAEWADDGDNLEWSTPCGNHPKQKYYVMKSAQFCTGNNDRLYYPPAFALTLATQFVQKNRTETQSGAVLGATANIVQSLDASLCAEVICRHFDKTGEIPYTIHDSFTVKRENADNLKETVCEVMRDMYTAPEMIELRRMLKIIPPKAGIDFSQMNPLSEE